MNYYFYILKCNDKLHYYGHANDLSRRIKEHARGKVWATDKRRPVELIYYERFSTRKEAFKKGKTRMSTVKKLIDGFPKEKCQGFNSDI